MPGPGARAEGAPPAGSWPGLLDSPRLSGSDTCPGGRSPWRHGGDLPPVAADPLTAARLDRILSFFAFAWEDRVRLGPAGAAYILIALIGLALCVRTEGLRFLAIWCVVGLAVTELLWQNHPHWDSTRRYAPAGLAIPAAVAVALAAARLSRTWKAVSVLAVVGTLLFDSLAVGSYFRQGRPD